MTHFLGRLVERARGTAPRVEPIIAPKFAPAPITEISAGIEAPSPAPSREEVNSWQSPPPARRFVRQEIEPPRGKEFRFEEKAAPPSEPEQLLVPPEILVSREATSVARRIGPEQVAVRPKTNGARPGSPLPAPARASVVAGIVDPSRPPIHSAISPNEPGNEPPIVRVTIGRIDVRAETPAPPPRKTSRPSGPKLSLDAYLKARKEGAR